MSSIVAADIEKMLEPCRCSASRNRLRAAVSHAYKIALQSKKVGENPATFIKAVKENNQRTRWLAADEEARLREAIRLTDPEREAELDIALQTGLRWSEQFSLEWRDVDMELRQMTIRSAKGSGKDEYVELNATAIRAIARLKLAAGDRAQVCQKTTYDAHHHWFKRVLAAANVPSLRWHDLSRTYASRLVMAGVDLYTVQELMRHSSPAMTTRYAHLSREHLKQAVARLDVGTPLVQDGLAPAPAKTYLQ